MFTLHCIYYTFSLRINSNSPIPTNMRGFLLPVLLCPVLCVSALHFVSVPSALCPCLVLSNCA